MNWPYLKWMKNWDDELDVPECVMRNCRFKDAIDEGVCCPDACSMGLVCL